MPYKQIVIATGLEEVHTREQLSDVYQFRSDRGFLALQKLCFWVLRKIGAFGWTDKTASKSYAFDPAELAYNLREQYKLAMHIYDREDCEILMGPKEFAELAHTGMIDQITVLPTMYELKITIIPWMAGLLVVPEKRRGEG